jgi:hypothetical protein
VLIALRDSRGDYVWREIKPEEGHQEITGVDATDGHNYTAIWVIDSPAEWQKFKRNDPAMLDQMPKSENIDAAMKGGIDLNQIEVNRTGKIIKMDFDPAQLNEFMKNGFEGFEPVIIKIAPIQSPLPLLGVGPRREEEQLAKV